jgi:hypothetical protein
MASATQAFLLTAELFGLSFAAIFVFWFAEQVAIKLFGEALASRTLPPGLSGRPISAPFLWLCLRDPRLAVGSRLARSIPVFRSVRD